MKTSLLLGLLTVSAAGAQDAILQSEFIFDPAPHPQCHASTIVETRDGLLHITYTWKRLNIRHVVINPAKLKTQPIIKGVWPE